MEGVKNVFIFIGTLALLVGLFVMFYFTNNKKTSTTHSSSKTVEKVTEYKPVYSKKGDFLESTIYCFSSDERPYHYEKVTYNDYRYTPSKSYELSEVQLKYDKKNKTISLKSSPKNFTEKIIKSDFVKLEPHNGRYKLCARLETKNYVVFIGQEYTIFRDSWVIEGYECQIYPKSESERWEISKGSPLMLWCNYEDSLNKTKE
jgi:hypothetical protein